MQSDTQPAGLGIPQFLLLWAAVLVVVRLAYSVISSLAGSLGSALAPGQLHRVAMDIGDMASVVVVALAWWMLLSRLQGHPAMARWMKATLIGVAAWFALTYGFELIAFGGVQFDPVQRADQIMQLTTGMWGAVLFVAVSALALAAIPVGQALALRPGFRRLYLWPVPFLITAGVSPLIHMQTVQWLVLGLEDQSQVVRAFLLQGLVSNALTAALLGVLSGATMIAMAPPGAFRQAGDGDFGHG